MIVLLLFTSVALAYGHDDSVEQLLDEAERLSSPQVRRAEASVSLFRRAITLARDSGDLAMEARAWSGLGSALTNLHRTEESRKALMIGLDLARRSGSLSAETSCLITLANFAQERGEFEDQLRYSQMAIDLGARTGYLPARLRGMNFYCASLRRHGLTERAIRMGRQMLAELDAAIRASKEFPGVLLFQIPYNLGKALADSGEVSEGMQLLERARQAAERQGILAGIWHCLHDAAEIHAHQGDLEAAARFYGRALEVARKIDSRDPEAETLRGLGEVAESHGDLESAMNHYRTALEVWDRFTIPFEIPETLTALSRVQWRAGYRTEAQRSLRQAITMAERAKMFSVLAQARLEMGRQSTETGSLHKARAEYQRALDIARGNGLRILVPQAWSGIATVERALGNPLRALEAYAAAADAIDLIRSRIPAQHQRISFAAKTHALYSDWMDLLLEMQRVEDAYLVLERERNRNLIDALSEVEPGPTARERIHALESRLVSIQMALRAPKLSASARKKFLDQLEDVERRLDLELPGGVSTQPRMTLHQMQRFLQPGELFVAFSLRPEVVVCFALTRNSLRHFRMVLPELDSRVAMFNHALAESNETGARKAGEPLTESLIGPLALKKGSRLLVSPSGDLAAVPFAALPDPVTHEPLLKSVEVSYASSLFALALQRSRPSATLPRDLMAVAPLQALPETLAEIERISRFARTKPDLLVDREASETVVKQRPLRDYKILHFASHAILDPQFPSRSAIELARQEGDDGKLQVREIYRLNLSDQLVVLSACATAYGRSSAAEGMQSLARAFTHAGARTVVGTLWRVEDRAAGRFVEQMYRTLAAGPGVAASVRAAQLAFCGERPYLTAAHWAPWVASGDPGHAVDLRGDQRNDGVLFAALGLLLIAAAAASKRWIRVVRRD